MTSDVRSAIGVDDLQRAGLGFRSGVARIGDGDWQRPTPCERWTVRQLVGHVVAGCQMTATLAAGGSRLDAIAVLGVDHLGDDPLAAVDDALERQQAAFGQPDVETRILHHPAGDMPAHQVMRFRLGDLVVHQWDLARALGLEETLDAALVRAVWDGFAPMLPMMAATGVYGGGPSGALGDDAPLQLRLLDAFGRRV